MNSEKRTMQINMSGAIVTIRIAVQLVALSFIHQSAGQNYTRDGEIHVTFPSDIPADVKEISILSAELSIFPEDSFEKFYQLETLILDFNPITYLPNLIPVGDTLKTISTVDCLMTTLNATVYNELRVLVSLTLRDCPIVSLPVVPHGPKLTLDYIGLGRGALTSFPTALGEYQALTTIIVTSTPIEGALTEADIAPNLQLLKLSSTKVSSLPEAPKIMSSLQKLHVQYSNVCMVSYSRRSYLQFL